MQTLHQYKLILKQSWDIGAQKAEDLKAQRRKQKEKKEDDKS